jgi:hypothetical protein
MGVRRLRALQENIDFSPHRALRLAEIEAEEGVRTTYFIHLHSEFYNALEKDVTRCILRIKRLGHDLGLHFDIGYYDIPRGDIRRLAERLRFERHLAERIFESHIQTFSYHNPEMGEWIKVDRDEIAGMVNAYGGFLRKSYSYISDSNGYWRFRRLKDVIEAGTEKRLYVLTHPAWWTPKAMSPRKRVARCIDGRAKATNVFYDGMLRKLGRKNVR